MHRMWEIRERDGGEMYHMRSNMRYNRREDEDVREAYECGYEHGYEKAMKDARYYNERGRGGSY